MKYAKLSLQLLPVALLLGSAAAQADTLSGGSLVINAGSGIINAGSVISVNAFHALPAGNSTIQVLQPVQTTAFSLTPGYASASVNGSLQYYTGTGYGNFSESDSSDGTPLAVALSRKGFGYDASASAASGTAQARAVTQTAAGIGGSSSASANASWTDWFVISGGTGTATASFASSLDGTLTAVRNGSAILSANMVYSTSSYCWWWYSTCSEADQDQTLFNLNTSLSGRGSSNWSQNLGGDFVFEYDKPFRLTASLSVNAANGGSADFRLSSLGASLALPQGAMLTSASGLFAQPVPEAETWAMMLAGLGMTGFMAMRRRSIL